MSMWPFVTHPYILKPYRSITAVNGTPVKLSFDKARHDMNETDDIKAFKSIEFELLELYRTKNHDYGDSFYETYSKFGLTSTCIRLHDKVKRLENLCKNGETGQVKDESVDDTLRDIINYSIMTLIARSQKESQ